MKREFSENHHLFHFFLSSCSSFCSFQQMASYFNSMIVRMLICLEISLFLTSTMAMDFSDGVGRSTKRFCGRMLTESLALICDGQYGTIIPTDKRSGMTSHFISNSSQLTLCQSDNLPIFHTICSFFSQFCLIFFGDGI